MKVTKKVTCSTAHEAIVEKDLFERVQQKLKSRGFGKCNGMRTEYLLTGKIICPDCNHKFQGRKVKNGSGKIYYYYADSGYKNYRICKALNIPKNTEGGVIGIEDFVVSEIEKMLDTDRYIAGFKEHLKDTLIGLERETDTVYPTLKKNLAETNKEIESVIDELLKFKSDALRERLQKKEAESERLRKEIGKYENIKSQPSRVLLLVNEYAKVLKNVGEVLRKRTPGEQKTAIGYFLDKIEVLRNEGVARCYFYDTPRPREIDYILPGSSGGCVPQVGAEGNGIPLEVHRIGSSAYNS